MTLPTYKFEIAFNAGVTTPSASRTWTDVTSYVLLDDGVDITYGRGDWRSEADANTLRLTLNNSDGRFTAGRAASPYYPNVKLGRPIRVTATVGGVSSVRFLGFIDEWPLEWPAAVTTFATAQITATSRIAWLNEGMELRSIIEEEILVDNPSAYFTLADAVGATQALDSSGNSGLPLQSTTPDPSIPGYTGAAVSFGNTSGPSTDGDLTSAQINGGKYLSQVNAFVGTQFTMAAFFAVAAYPTAGNNAVLLSILGSNNFRLDIDSSGGLRANFSATGTTLALNQLYHLAMAQDGSSCRTYVNGVQVSTAGYVGGFSATRLEVGFNGGAPATTSVASAVVAHVGFWQSGLSASRVAAHAAAGLNGFTNETPAARIARYASYADIAATELSLDTGQVPGLMHLDTTGTTAVDMMRKIEATEEGILFDRADGLLGFHDRAHRYTMTPAFVLDVNQGQVGSGMEPRLDRTTVRNDVTTTSTDGTVTAHVTNASSISTYGPARESIEVATSNADEPFEHASWLVNQYNDAQPRVPSLTVDLNNLTTALSQSVLAAAVSTQFTVKNLPSQAAVSSQDYIVEGYSESFGAARHSITFNISQATPYAVFTIGDPIYGQYDAYPIAL